MKRLTKAHLAAMSEVRTGSDVWSPALARALREVEKFNPLLIDIGEPRARNYKGHEALPYFGAILTKAGCEAVDNDGIVITDLADMVQSAFDELTLARAMGDQASSLMQLLHLNSAMRYLEGARHELRALERQVA